MERSSALLVNGLGPVICVLALYVTVILSYLALKSRRRGVNRDSRRTSVSAQVYTNTPLCRHCHQVQTIDTSATSVDYVTKGWTCSLCNGLNSPIEVSTSADEEDSNDLEIQHTLGGLAISQTNTPEVRAPSPHSWLRSIKDLKLLPEHTPCHYNDADLYEKNGESLEIQRRNSSPCNTQRSSTAEGCKSAGETHQLCVTNGCSKKPLIQPARLRVRKRQISLTSATAALSLSSGNGWSLGNRITQKTNTDRLSNGLRQPRSFLNNNGHFVNSRQPNVDQRCNVSNPTLVLGDRNHGNNVMRCTANGSERLVVNNRLQNSSPHKDLDILNLSELNLSDTATVNPSLHQHSSTTLAKRQPQSAGIDYCVVHGNRSPPPSNRVGCSVATLILLSLSANVILLLILVVYMYRPTSATTVL